MIETMRYGYSSESTQRDLSNEYQHDRVYMVFKSFSVLVLWTKVASALEGLRIARDPKHDYSQQNLYCTVSLVQITLSTVLF